MRENAGASRFSVPLPPALAPQGEAHQCRGNPITGRGRIRRETCHSRSSKWLQKPGLCVHRADGAGHCDHWAVIELGERDLVRAGELSLGGGKEGDKGKGRQSQQTRGGGAVLPSECPVWSGRGHSPLCTPSGSCGWPRAGSQSPTSCGARFNLLILFPPKMIKLFLAIFLMRENVSQ